MTIALFALSLIIAVNGDLVNDTDISVQNKVLETLNPTAEITLSFEKLLKKSPKIECDHADERGCSIPEINERSGVDEELFQSDILLTMPHTEDIPNEGGDANGGATVEETSRSKRQAVTDPNQLWDNGIVYYYFDDSLSNDLRRIFLKAVDLWQKDSCVKFIPNFGAVNRISVQADKGCLSPIGRVGGVQRISLGKGCGSVDIVAHEIGHALGLYHTMARNDRDMSITMNFANVQPYYRDKLLGEGTQTFELPYDYGSIMHYGESSVSINKKEPAMLPLEYDFKYTLGSPFVSFLDLVMVNKLYGCDGLCKAAESVVCEMEGFPNPRNCSKCVCPFGYGGDRCTERPNDGCGGAVDASLNWTTLTNFLGDTSVPHLKEDFKTCTYWINSPAETEIEVELLSFTDNFDYDAVCTVAWKSRQMRTNDSLAIVSVNEPRPTSRTVKPFPTTTQTPLPDSFWIYGEAASQCVDHPNCAPYATAVGLCYGRSLISVQLQIYCPKTCRRCSIRHYANSATAADPFHINKG